MNKQHKLIKTLSISFNHPIREQQINRWRGAFLEMVGWEEDLCHNHNGAKNTYYRRYPLVQYRAEHGKAALFAMGEGVSALQKVLAQSDWELCWDGVPRTLMVEDLRMEDHYMQMLPKMKVYRLRQWLALNTENFKRWNDIRGIVGRMQFLQRMLENHVMVTVWGLGYKPSRRVGVCLLDLERQRHVRHHGTNLLAFDVVFETDVLLPRLVGVGKGVSHGFGALELMRMPVPKHDNKRQVKQERIV